jgi:Phosphoesterase family
MDADDTVPSSGGHEVGSRSDAFPTSGRRCEPTPVGSQHADRCRWRGWPRPLGRVRRVACSGCVHRRCGNGVVVLVVAVAAIGCSSSGPSKTSPSTSASTRPSSSVVPGIHKIKHVIVIMQENRSFDSYFGTYPGAAGIPMVQGKPTVCVPRPRLRRLRQAVSRSCRCERRRTSRCVGSPG